MPSHLRRAYWFEVFGVSFAFLLAVTILGCAVPVEVRNTYDGAGRPQPLAVAPEPQQVTLLPPADGSTTGAWTGRIEAAPDAAPVAPPAPATDWAGILMTLLSTGVGLAGGTWAVRTVKTVGRLKDAVKIVSDLADANAQAETDDDVKFNVAAAQRRQQAAGVEHEVQRIRGKPVKPRL